MLMWFRKNTKGIMIVVAVLFVGSMFYGLGSRGIKGDWSGKGGSDVIAKVNGQAIDPLRFREIFNRVAAGFGQNIGTQDIPFVANLALGQAINFTLMVKEAEKRVRVSGREVDSAVDNIMRQQKIPSQKDLRDALKRAGIPYDKFRDLLKEEIMVQKLSMKLREDIRITPDDLREVKASHILVSTESQAKDLLAKLNAGEDFAALAKRYSRDTVSAAKGGDLGYFSLGSMVEPFENAAFSLKPGQTSGITKTQFGYHIIKLADSRLRKFPGDQKNIEQTALREKQEKVFRRWYADVQSKARIEIIAHEFKAHDLRFKGQLAEAAAEYKQAIAQTPANAFLHVFLADTYMSMGQKELALAEYENAVRVQGANPELYLIAGKAYENAGRHDLATEQFKKASMIAGENKPLHEKLLKVFQSMKQQAMVAFEKEQIQKIEKKENFVKEIGGQK